jgi:CubicO group peptidase (beta-lactamase class C family)
MALPRLLRPPVLLISLLLPGALFAQAPSSAASASDFADFDAYVERVIKEWKVPGAAIVVVKDGKVVLSKGYGLRDVKGNLPVTEQTLFPIASITKSFTVATLATFSSEGKLDWDKPVRDYLPDFRLYDDVLTARVTTRDLVSQPNRPAASRCHLVQLRSFA